MNRIAEHRKQVGLTQLQAAKLAGWGQSRWSSYETGARTPDASDIKKILAVLVQFDKNVNFEVLFLNENVAA
ncbi:helix-turn-helix domain-containing protein [Zhongshania guokunii]|uniref:Helix-turn-helix domain-containing protein n=1 Tax=Zhongshania guokunii TaxID=641783 RepID=A0ABV3U7J8_9GAMM